MQTPTVHGSTEESVARPAIAREAGLASASRALRLLAALAVVAAVYLLRPILVPVAVAWVGKLTLTPAHRRLVAWRVPAAVSGGVLLGAVLASVAVGAFLLVQPVQTWAQRAPALVDQLEARLDELAEPLSQAREIAEAVEDMEIAGETRTGTVQVELASRGQLVGEILSGARLLLAQAVVVAILLFFMLATDHHFLARIVSLSPGLSERKRWVALVRDVESQFASYLGTVTAINALLGVAVGLSSAALGLPSPLLWGVMAAVLNFVPLLGALVGVAVVAVVGIVSIDGLVAGLMPAAAYLVLTTIEGWLVTPAILGRRMALNPIILVVWLLFWSWAWGVAGALLAVPLLVAFKISLEHRESTRPLAALLGA